MNIECRAEGEVMVVKPLGRIDGLTSNQFQTTLNELLQKNVRQLVIDMSEVSLVTSAGLRVLLRTRKQLLAGENLVLCGLSASVMQIVQLAGFDTFLPICQDREAALAKVKG